MRRSKATNTNPLEHVLGQVSKIRILRHLVKTMAELNGREMAAAVGISHVKAHTALKELNQYSVVEMRRMGKSILYRLNLKNLLVKKALIPLFENESRLIQTVAEIFQKHFKKPKPKSVILFGSFASGRARPDSDIDVLVVASNKQDISALDDNLKKAEARITMGFGNALAPIVMDETDFKRGYKNKNKLILDAVKEGKVIFGDTINDLLKFND